MITLKESILSSTNSGRNSIGIGKYKIGMIMSAPFSYSSRHNYWYEIVGVKGKATIIVRELAQRIVSSDGYNQNGTSEPILGKYTGEPFNARIDKRGNLKIEGRLAEEWNGKPEPFYTD